VKNNQIMTKFASMNQTVTIIEKID